MIPKTKAQTLEWLKKQLPEANILPLVIVDYEAYRAHKEDIICDIRSTFYNCSKVIVRSSSCREDNAVFSNAGKFLSVANVSCHEKAELQNAIERVYDSYGEPKGEEIFVQPMLRDIAISGVVLTKDASLNTPYYTINYAESGNTAAVTGGNEAQLKTVIVYRKKLGTVTDERIKRVLALCKQIEQVMQQDALDIEFAADLRGKIYILQVRPIAKGMKAYVGHDELENALDKLHKKIEKLMRPNPFLLGKTTCFGVMPDWNPAEILGIRPRKLAISLYKELITDNVWAHQRSDYGYRDLTMQPLMISFCGIPYIDTRVTFNSFIPKTLHKNLAEKLVNYYLEQLILHPAYHDKIEFEIVFSCYYFGVSEQLEALLEHGFSKNELKQIEFSLLDLTNKVIHPKEGLCKKDIEKAQVLLEKYDCIVHSEMSIVDQIYWLIEQCKSYGTLPFAGVARAGFIAVQFLKSFGKR